MATPGQAPTRRDRAPAVRYSPLTMRLDRVVVVGTSCSGKTTFARRLAEILASPYVELDALYWGPGWTPRPGFQRDAAAAAGQGRWVIDGNYSAVRDAVWRRSTAIVWLDLPFPLVFSRALRRTVARIVTGERLYGGDNRETIRGAFLAHDGIPWWVIRTHRKRRREYAEMLGRPEYRHATRVRLRSPAEAEAFLTSVDTSLNTRADSRD